MYAIYSLKLNNIADFVFWSIKSFLSLPPPHSLDGKNFKGLIGKSTFINLYIYYIIYFYKNQFLNFLDFYKMEVERIELS